jgi:hypothetical protein
MPLNAALRRLNEAGGSEFEASLGFIVKPCLKKKVTNKFKKKNNTTECFLYLLPVSRGRHLTNF